MLNYKSEVKRIETILIVLRGQCSIMSRRGLPQASIQLEIILSKQPRMQLQVTDEQIIVSISMSKLALV